MNPDQEEEVTTTTSSVNDPYENRRKSKYAKEQPASTVDGTTFIIPSRSSTSMNSPSYHHQQGQKAQRRQESKEPFTIHQQQDEFYSKNLLIASTLVVTYLIEVTVQILLIVQCCRSIQKLEVVMDSFLESTIRSISSWSWVLVMSSVGSSLLVTLVSIIWVFRGMDFSGRLCGRLLCYVMHSFLLALLWRYLKLAFAYDRADLEEFFRLKTIQTYVQSLPLVTIHLAWLLTAQQLLPVYFYQTPFDSYHALSSWLVVAEMLSVVTSFLVLSSVSSASSSASVPPCNGNYLRGKLPRKKKQGGSGDNNNPNHPFNDSGTASTGEEQAGGKLMMVMREPKLMTRVALYSRKSELGRGLLLISRLISLGMLVYEMNYWTGFITLLHLAVCFAWLSLWVIFTRRTDNEDENVEAGISSKSFDNKNCDSSANDSGLVVKSDVDVVKMQNGFFHHQHPDNSVNVENYNVKQGQISTFSKYLSVLQSDKLHPGNENVRQVLTRVTLPLTYLLFWDMSPLPLMTVGVSNRLNLWATALPVFLTAVENMSITIFHVYNQQNMIWTVASGTCLLCGWVLVAASLFQRRQRRALTLQRQDKEELSQVQVGDIQNDSELEDDDHANPEKQRGKPGKEKSVNKKETGECLSMCCSSLSHPLNIKRKGHAQPHQEHNFCQTSDNHNDKKDFGNEQSAIHADVILKSHNEYQQTAKQHNHNSNSGRSKKGMVVKNSIMFPDLGITSAHTGVALGGESELQRESMMNFCRYQEDVVACATAPTKPQSSSSTTTPVTNNYTNIKEALTRRISNKSCASSSKKQSHHQNHHCMNQERESVKGEVEGGLGEVVISSFKSSSSPSTRLPQPPTTTNSNKCMPISIKSPISWLPETCCNDSSGSGGSSNSRNTNTLLPDPRFYCPENYIDLDNNNEHELSHNRKTELERTVRPRRGGSDDCDFSIVFFEDRGTARKPKQKQSRTAAAATGSNALRAVRSANATPVVSSKQFPLDIPIPTQAAIVRQIQHQHFHPHQNHHDHHHHLFQHQQSQYNLDDDPIERASRGTRRNQIMGKTYLSDGGSLTSLDGLCEIRASTPVEIKKASRVIVNYPPPHHQIEDSKTVSRCLCKVDTNPPLPISSSPGTRRKCPDGEVVNVHCDKAITGANNIYEKLIDDSYGILICEGENTPHQRKNCNNGGVSSKKCIVSNNKGVTELSENELGTSCRVGGGVVASAGVQKLRILCAKCLENHDPLLTNCLAMNENDGEDDNNFDDDDPDENSPYTNKNHYNPSSINVNLKNHQHHHVHFGEMNKSLPQLVSHYPNVPHNHRPGSDTTDYPSDTEFTTNNVVEDDGQSLSTHFSSATCTWHHNHYQPTQLSQFIWAASSMMPTSSGNSGSQCPKEFTSLEYVRTWLMASHPRTFAINNNFNNTHQHLHHNSHHENGISDNKRTLCQRAKTLTPLTTNNNWRDEKGLVLSSSSKNKSSCDKAISKKKRFRQLEKRQRPVGRGASPPAKELGTSSNANNTEPSTTTGGDATEGAGRGFQPPPSRKQHPLLFYDMIPRQPQQKPLTATPHKKCRDQLDLFHKELETVV